MGRVRKTPTSTHRPAICGILGEDWLQGLPVDAFKRYHERYRRGKLASDLEQLDLPPELRAARAAGVGLGRIIALYCRSFTLYQIR